MLETPRVKGHLHRIFLASFAYNMDNNSDPDDLQFRSSPAVNWVLLELSLTGSGQPLALP